MTTELEIPAKPARKAITPFTAQPIEMGSIQADLDAYKADCLSITVSGPDDRAGRDLAYTNRQKVKTTRIAFEKAIDASLVGPKAYIKEVTEMEKPMVIEFKAIEAHLAAQEKIVDDAIEAAKRQKEQDEADKIAGRINALNLLGARYENSQYEVCGVLIDSIEVTALPDDEFRELLDSATAAYNTEQTRLAEIEAERLAEVARVAAEQEAVRQQQEVERLKLQALADENRRVADEQARQMAEFNRKQRDFEQKQREAEAAEEARLKAIEREKELQQWTARVDQLTAAGFVDHGPFFEHPHYKGSHQKPIIGHFDDVQFAQFLQRAADETEQAQAKAAQAAIDEAARIKAEKQAEAKRKAADRERHMRLAPDKNRLSKFFVLTGNTPAAEVEEQEAIDLQIEFIGRLHELVTEFKARLTTL